MFRRSLEINSGKTSVDRAGRSSLDSARSFNQPQSEAIQNLLTRLQSVENHLNDKQGVFLFGCRELDRILLKSAYREMIEKNQILRDRFVSLYHQAIRFLSQTRKKYSRELFVAIPAEEFSNISEEKATPVYDNMVDDVAHSCFVIQRDILKRQSLGDALLGMERWIAVLKQCSIEKDFHGVQLILMALDHSVLRGLRKSKEDKDDDLLSDQAQAVLTDGRKWLENNYALLHDKMKHSHAIPDLRLFKIALKSEEKESVIKTLLDQQKNLKTKKEVSDHFWNRIKTHAEALLQTNPNLTEIIGFASREISMFSMQKTYQWLYKTIADPLDIILGEIEELVGSMSSNAKDNSQLMESRNNLDHVILFIKNNSGDKNSTIGALIVALQDFKKQVPVLPENRWNIFKWNIFKSKRKNNVLKELDEIIKSLENLQSKKSALQLWN